MENKYTRGPRHFMKYPPVSIATSDRNKAVNEQLRQLFRQTVVKHAIMETVVGAFSSDFKMANRLHWLASCVMVLATPEVNHQYGQGDPWLSLITCRRRNDAQDDD